MDLNQDELDLVSYMIDEVWDEMSHHPDGWSQAERHASSTLYEKVKLAKKQLRSKR